ncbi:hypothetical protein PYCC9005_003818 [Savitreella phatthalungensis]
MPIEAAAYAFVQGTLHRSLEADYKIWSVIVLCCFVLVRLLLQEPSNPHADTNMHGKVVIITGATSGIGLEVATALARRGTQLVILVSKVQDGWTQQFVMDLRQTTGNQLIYAEECDLSSLLSIRRFATRWIDTTPPRRLDQVVLCHGISLPPGSQRRTTKDGTEIHLGIHHLAVSHLLTLLQPALRSQPADRDVRVIATTCTSYTFAELDMDDIEWLGRGYPSWTPWRVLGTAKLLSMVSVLEMQRQVAASRRRATEPEPAETSRWRRDDGMPSRVKFILADPGIACRTPGFRRFVSCDSLAGLLFLYVIPWPLWWFVVRSAERGAQSVLYACTAPPSTADPGDEDVAVDRSLTITEHKTTVGGGEMIHNVQRSEWRGTGLVKSPEFAQTLAAWTRHTIETTERRSAQHGKKI